MTENITIEFTVEEVRILTNIFYDFKFDGKELPEGQEDEVLESLLQKLNVAFRSVPDDFVPPPYPFWKNHPNYNYAH